MDGVGSRFAIILGVVMAFGWRYVLYFIIRRCEFEITYVTDYSSKNQPQIKLNKLMTSSASYNRSAINTVGIRQHAGYATRFKSLQIMNHVNDTYESLHDSQKKESKKQKKKTKKDRARTDNRGYSLFDVSTTSKKKI